MLSAADRIRALPCWKGSIEVEPLKGGLSNENYLVQDAAGRHVVRFGRDYPFHHVSREREVMVARAAHAAGFGPEVRFAAPGVMVTAYLGAKTYDANDVRSNARRIGALLKRFHRTMPTQITGPGFIFWVFHVVRDYAVTLKQGNSPHIDLLPRFLAENRALEDTQRSMSIVFGHHDLLPANFLDDGSRLWLIDYEYAGFGTGMFDLAGVASNAGMNENESAALLGAYFVDIVGPTTYKSFDAMQCASLLRETMWAMVSALHLNAPGVDYDAYTRENMERYEQALERFQFRYGKLIT